MNWTLGTQGRRAGVGATVVAASAVLLLQAAVSGPVEAAAPQPPNCGPTIAASWEESNAIRTDGKLYGWGNPESNEFGLGPTSESTTYRQPVAQGLSGTAVGVWAPTDDDFNLVLKSDGTLWAAGYNNNGSLGAGDTLPHAGYVQVSTATGLTSALQLAAGDSPHALALAPDHTVWGWGQNSSGSVGDGTSTQRTRPVQVVGPSGTGTLGSVVAVSAGRHSVALKADGTVWTWGSGTSGALGNGGTASSTKPVQVVGATNGTFLTGVVAISAAYHHTLALKSDGTVWAWGENNHGQLGNNSPTSADSSRPVQVVGTGGTGFLSGVVAVSAGYQFSMALLSDGTVRSWGSNSAGQLGNGLSGSANDSKVPVAVKGIGGNGSLSGVSAISAGREHSLALKPDGSVLAWGTNYAGQMGNNTGGNETDQQVTPVQVSRSTGLTAVPGSCLAVSAVSPASTSNATCPAGQAVTLTGSGFLGATAVTFGQAPAVSFNVTSDQAIRAVAPAGVGTADVRVTTPRGVTAATASDHYTCTLAAAVVVTPSPTPTAPPPGLPKAGSGAGDGPGLSGLAAGAALLLGFLVVLGAGARRGISRR